MWERSGSQLCEHFGYGMKFVRENTLSPVNHLIFVLDHSGSMNERRKTSTRSTTSIGQRSDTAWEHLRRAVQGLIDIDLNRINTPMNVYGSGTKFSAAFQVVIKTLEEANNGSDYHNLRQTIIFITSGEPQGYSSVELQSLREYKGGT